MKTDGARYELEHEADMTRARLLRTIDALDRKRRELFDFKLQLRRHTGDIVSAAGGLLIGAGATAAVVLYRRHRHERRVRQERVRAIARLWQHPERIAARQSMLGTAVRLVLVVVATMATTTLGTHQLERIRKKPRLPAHPVEPLGL
jgi:hypothetical protein